MLFQQGVLGAWRRQWASPSVSPSLTCNNREHICEYFQNSLGNLDTQIPLKLNQCTCYSHILSSLQLIFKKHNGKIHNELAQPFNFPYPLGYKSWVNSIAKQRYKVADSFPIWQKKLIPPGLYVLTKKVWTFSCTDIFQKMKEKHSKKMCSNISNKKAATFWWTLSHSEEQQKCSTVQNV